MIRLSQLTALHILNEDVARDLNASPKLYAYKSTANNRTNTLLIQEDTSSLQQMTRKHAYSPFWNNALLGTANFYPEQGLDLENFHNNSSLENLLPDTSLPVIEYKKAILYFSQGLLSDPNIKGHAIRLYCKLNNGTEVTLASVADFMNDSNITAKPSKFFESQLWNEGLEIEFIDVEYLLNSNVPEVNDVKELLFGNERPTEILVEYSAFTEESIDDFVENEILFTRLSFRELNEQSFPTTFEKSEMYLDLRLSDNGFCFISEPKHTRFDFESYINKLKKPEETYSVRHYFTVSEYDSDNNNIGSNTQIVGNPVQPFDEILYRPIVNSSTDHFVITGLVLIENNQTGLVYRTESTMVVPNSKIQPFTPNPWFEFNLTEDKIQNRVNRQVNKIVQSPEVPKVITIEKKLYVQAMELNELRILDADQTIKLNISEDITGNKKLYLKIDNMIIENEENNISTFMIPKHTYMTKSKTFALLDESYSVISTGKLTKI
jgi:hypothetical protein